MGSWNHFARIVRENTSCHLPRSFGETSENEARQDGELRRAAVYERALRLELEYQGVYLYACLELKTSMAYPLLRLPHEVERGHQAEPDPGVGAEREFVRLVFEVEKTVRGNDGAVDAALGHVVNRALELDSPKKRFSQIHRKVQTEGREPTIREISFGGTKDETAFDCRCRSRARRARQA